MANLSNFAKSGGSLAAKVLLGAGVLGVGLKNSFYTG